MNRRQSWGRWLLVIGLLVLMIWPRLTALNQYLIVDEADRWRWASEFVQALHRGDLAGTLVGDGYPGIVPVWAETLWILLEAGRRSVVEGQWIGQIGLGHLLHEWDRTELLFQQRLPIVLMNTTLALAVVGAVWRLFGSRVALVSGVLIALDPFYLSDSRVNRAEAVITGLMTLSVLALIFYYQRRQFRYVLLSGVLGGLSFLTKIQALSILPVVVLSGILIYRDAWRSDKPLTSLPWMAVFKFGAAWGLAAGLTWFLLWPAMWVTPLETLTLVFNYTTRKVGAEGVSLFFLGETYQDTDPGLFFYPFVFLMRLTPLVLLGLIGALWPLIISIFRASPSASTASPAGQLETDPFASKGIFILVIYILLYTLVMTVGSHKQDRYLMPIFLGLDILAAMGLVFISYRLAMIRPQFWKWEGAFLAGLVVIQLATVLPHHPYYYSYFNPLLGGGQTAARTLRIGWGEGMDQVGDYLAAKANSRELVVSTRFTHNMLNFRGEVITLGQDGRWTRADYLVLYIQQVQRRLDPSPGFLDYFQAHEPEKVITLGGIDYAWIYPIPFTTPANPHVSVFPDEAALLGYSWESASPALRLLWKNLGHKAGRQLVARLVNQHQETGWSLCAPDPAFTAQAATPGAFVESLCRPAVDNLSPGLYTVEFGLTSAGMEAVDPFLFPEGRLAAQVMPSGQVKDSPDLARLQAIAGESVPPAAVWLDRVYDERLRLIAYQLDPARPEPGQSVELRLYWQPLNEILEPLHLTVQLADSRLLPLGRRDTMLAPASGQNAAGWRWLPGLVQTTSHTFKLSPELDAPLAGRIEITLRDEAEIPLRAAGPAATPLDKVVDYFTVAPPDWPSPDGVAGKEAAWQNDIYLRGLDFPATPVRVGESVEVTLFWQTNQSIDEDYMIFVHLLDETGQIVAQNDSLPRAGAYPAPWWLPGVLIEDTHRLTLPAEVAPDKYFLVVGLYRVEDGTRLPLAKGGDSLSVGEIHIR